MPWLKLYQSKIHGLFTESITLHAACSRQEPVLCPINVQLGFLRALKPFLKRRLCRSLSLSYGFNHHRHGRGRVRDGGIAADVAVGRDNGRSFYEADSYELAHQSPVRNLAFCEIAKGVW